MNFMKHGSVPGLAYEAILFIPFFPLFSFFIYFFSCLLALRTLDLACTKKRLISLRYPANVSWVLLCTLDLLRLRVCSVGVFIPSHVFSWSCDAFWLGFCVGLEDRVDIPCIHTRGGVCCLYNGVILRQWDILARFEAVAEAYGSLRKPAY